MAYEVEFTEEFEQWWNSLDADEQESVDFSVRLLEARHSSQASLRRHGQSWFPVPEHA